MPSRLTLKLPTLEAGLEEAARSLAEMVRDSVPRHHTRLRIVQQSKYETTPAPY
jgi:hypothetical protein